MAEGGELGMPAPFPREYRASGVLMPLLSLPCRYGIGDLGPTALAWIDRLREAGQGWWQALPLGPTGYGNSPYQPLSSFAGNELVVSPDGLMEEGLLRPEDCSGYPNSPDVIDYAAVIAFKRRLLETAFRNFMAGNAATLRLPFERFGVTHAYWLDDYALFRALKDKYGGAHYLEWPAELVRRDASALATIRVELREQIDEVRFSQFLLFRQAKALTDYARSKSIHLSATYRSSFHPTPAIFGQIRNFFCSIAHADHVSSPVSHPIISVHTASDGATLYIAGIRFDRPVIAGGSSDCAPA